MLTTSTGLPFDVPHIVDQILGNASMFWVYARPLAIKVIAALGDKIPPEVLEALTDLDGGLSDEELAKWQVKLTEIANKAIDIPGLPETAEAWLISPVVGYLLHFAKSGKALTLSVA